MSAFGRVAPDGEEVRTPSNGDDWRLAWHPPPAAALRIGWGSHH